MLRTAISGYSTTLLYITVGFASLVGRSSPLLAFVASNEQRRQEDSLLDLGVVQDDLEGPVAVVTWWSRHVDGDVELRRTRHERVVATQLVAGSTVVERHAQVGGAVGHVTW